MAVRRRIFAIAAVLLTIVLVTSLLEGIVSLVADRSLVRSAAGGPARPPRLRMTEEERTHAAALTPGQYAADLDPAIGITMKADFAFSFHGAAGRTDARGWRVRPGPPAVPGATRIVVLGDSVAFGFGLEDTETIGHQLEVALAGAMPDGAPRPWVKTVACPGWNFRNAKRSLLDHLDELDPDVVLFVVVQNDLDDAYAALETGHRMVDYDPFAGGHAVHCSVSYHHELFGGLRAILRDRIPGEEMHGDNYVLTCGVTPESRRRFGELADELGRLHTTLAGREARFGLVTTSPGPFEMRLLLTLEARAVGLPIFGLFDHLDVDDTLGDDPHPNARCARAGAIRLAHAVAAAGWVDGVDAARLPRDDPRYADKVFRRPDAAQLTAFRERIDQIADRVIGPRLDMRTGLGYFQLYGGTWSDGVVGPVTLAALRQPRPTVLRLEAEGLADHPSLYPLELRVTLDGQPLESVRVADAGSHQVFELAVDPAAIGGGPLHDVEIRAADHRHGLIPRLDVGRLVSFRLRSLELDTP